MKSLPDAVLEKIKYSRHWFIFVYDPDQLLLVESIQRVIISLNFQFFQFFDPFSFRLWYESEIRPNLYNSDHSFHFIVRIEIPIPEIPYDIFIHAETYEVGLASIFDKLSTPVVKNLDVSLLEQFYESYQTFLPQKRLGSNETTELILRLVFSINIDAINTIEDLFENLIRIHYKRIYLPSDYSEYILQKLETKKFSEVDGIDIFDYSSFIDHLQVLWNQYLDSVINGERPKIFLEKTEIWVYLDSMIIEGIIRPVSSQSIENLPPRLRIGVAHDSAETLENRFLDLLHRTVSLANIANHYSDWQKICPIWADILNLRMKVQNQKHIEKFNTVQSNVEELFLHWIQKSYPLILNAPYLPEPVMVHHILPYIKSKRKNGDKIALIVIDGLAFYEWELIQKEILKNDNPKIIPVFAHIPTLTSISRKSIFSGVPPFYLFENSDQKSNSINDITQSKERNLWINYWSSSETRGTRISHFTGIRLKDITDQSKIQEIYQSDIVGLVINTIDEFIHEENFSYTLMPKKIREWLDQGFVSQFFNTLQERGFNIFITSDHGHILAQGIGDYNEGELLTENSKRAKIFKDKAFQSRGMSKLDEQIIWPSSNFNNILFPLLMSGTRSYDKKNHSSLCHGGISIEEVLVPFIEILR
ncbi:MAG: BREX-3 system phosphatase PglZ [Methanomicrobiales archaeon]|nr:BREX-3 system phosphatase PglZ [Methanomicrobiales archaeon]